MSRQRKEYRPMTRGEKILMTISILVLLAPFTYAWISYNFPSVKIIDFEVASAYLDEGNNWIIMGSGYQGTWVLNGIPDYPLIPGNYTMKAVQRSNRYYQVKEIERVG